MGGILWGLITAETLKRLENKYAEAGADFGFISANMPHIVFDRVKELSPLPLISNVEATCKYMNSLSFKRVGLLGTKFTMENNFIKKLAQMGYPL